MRLLITGASGRLGRMAADHVLTRIAPEDLILATRTPEALSAYARRGVEVREADFERPQTLKAAFEGASRALLISTDALGRRGGQHGAAVDAAVGAGVGFVAYTSFVLAGAERPSFVDAEHIETEAHIRASGLEWCFLRNFPYADNELGPMRDALDRGELVTNTGAGETAFVARADCAAAAAAVLCGEGHAGRTYHVTGPQLIDAEARAAIFSEVGGRPVTVTQVDDETLAREISQAGGPPLEVARQIAGGVGRATRDGYFAVRTDAVEKLTGRPARSLRTVLESAL
ncbi:NAD(P)H-binding protein [Streptomyces mangrovisoli]|uniref:NAD(P)-binding domain-containing protein n=1 Tax=Streptomyces mangrovisoli TaxID=1428628 RepID=A0A1J4NRQ9_9ACTN|nr:NAD(P)H-binding protein [Streptomyces mangrovisoli]OIJ65003.1 hypothetical protein WN71_025715 [Streptomyces mangrovisoli]